MLITDVKSSVTIFREVNYLHIVYMYNTSAILFYVKCKSLQESGSGYGKEKGKIFHVILVNRVINFSNILLKIFGGNPMMQV